MGSLVRSLARLSPGNRCRQELLAFLLNGLNEDLNRIADKPYIEQPDSDGRSDAELADIWWKNHLRREFSIVVALFAGQFKSLLACRECGYELSLIHI